MRKLLAEISELRNQLMSAHNEIALLLKENRDLRDALGVVNGEHYGSFKSQKGICKQRNTKGRNDGRDDFDGTLSLGNDDDASCTSDGDSDISFDQTAGDEDSKKYQMSTSSYRETKNRLADMNWDTCRQTFSNWADKGAVQLNKLIPVLKDVALQTGSDVIDIDHLCCLAHARAKFRKALDQGCGKARYFLLKIGDLYGREEEYRRLDLPPDEIFKRRNDA